MFDFEKLNVYKLAKELNKDIFLFLESHKGINPFIKDQLRRASISVVLNIAEGSGKFSKADKRNFYTTARGSVYETVSLFEIIYEERHISEMEFGVFYDKLEQLSKMLLGLINSQR